MSQKNNKNVKNKINEPRINNELYGNYDVRVVYTDDNGNNQSIVTNLKEAKRMAYEKELDLIEINPTSRPPVMKIADYSKYLYELKKHAKAQNKNKVELKEISLSVSITKHDLEIKAKKAKEFIAKGDKVKVTLMMRRREAERREESKRSILEFILLMDDVAVPEALPKDEGNKCIVILKRKS